ncbi:hypothetical protein KUH03_17405 [Sphingobacterium sp. E70]|uniref:hypothetical protein n=1 Tax=Sphingobacterium sp. E70 TaxID=2853439 RepID=UPI00211B7D89|nr:hypothetical protein [Sphingobacterium sp. E70]ULT28208.1 hypothetical protein KUH03_17405 [Sphingobacterium sp. E70]
MQVQLEYIQYQEGSQTFLGEPRIQSATGMLRLNSYLQSGSSFLDSSQSYLQDQVRASISNLTGSLSDIVTTDSISCRLITKYIPALGQKMSSSFHPNTLFFLSISKIKVMNKEEQLSADTILPIMFRGLGLLLAIDMWRLWPDLSMLFGQGIFLDQHSISWQQRPDTPSIHTLIANLPEYTLASLEWIHFFGLLYIICGLALFLTTIAEPQCWGSLYCIIFFIANYTWSYGADYLAQTGLFTGFIFCCLESRGLPHQRWARLGSTVFRLQLTFVYFFAGLGKAIGPTWWNGKRYGKPYSNPWAQHCLLFPNLPSSLRLSGQD